MIQLVIVPLHFSMQHGEVFLILTECSRVRACREFVTDQRTGRCEDASSHVLVNRHKATSFCGPKSFRDTAAQAKKRKKKRIWQYFV